MSSIIHTTNETGTVYLVTSLFNPSSGHDKKMTCVIFALLFRSESSEGSVAVMVESNEEVDDARVTVTMSRNE